MEPMIWLGILAVLLIIEAITAGLTTIWFAGGALVQLPLPHTVAQELFCSWCCFSQYRLYFLFLQDLWQCGI